LLEEERAEVVEDDGDVGEGEIANEIERIGDPDASDEFVGRRLGEFDV